MGNTKLAVCWYCKEVLPGELGRSTVCIGCDRDARVCLNCRYYDTHSYNECHESQAERVVDKERANFCDYFSSNGKSAGSSARGGGKKPSQSKSEARKAAEALFK